MKKALNSNKNALQKGFTLIEMMIVLVVIGILAAFFSNTGFGAKDDANFGLAKTYLSNTFPTNVARYAMRTNGVCTSVTKAILTGAPYNMDTTTVYATTWTLTGAAATATLVFPAGGSSVATDLAASITAKGPISSVAASGSNVTVVYKCS